MNAADAMTLDPVSVPPQTVVVEAARLVLQRRISLPVTDAKGAVAGVLTEGGLLRRAETGTEPHRTGWLAFLMAGATRR